MQNLTRQQILAKIDRHAQQLRVTPQQVHPITYVLLVGALLCIELFMLLNSEDYNVESSGPIALTALCLAAIVILALSLYLSVTYSKESSKVDQLLVAYYQRIKDDEEAVVRYNHLVSRIRMEGIKAEVVLEWVEQECEAVDFI